MSNAPESSTDAGDQVWRQFTRGNIAWDRLLALNDAIEILQKAKPDARGLDDVATKRDELDALLTSLRELKDTDAFKKGLDTFEADLELAEGRLMRVDTQVPIPLLRKCFETEKFLEQTIARYVSILCRHIDTHPERRDRVDFLATRLFSERLPNGRLQMRPYSEVYDVLRAMMPDALTDFEGHADAVAFFRDAIRRLGEFQTLQQMFDSGFYVDVRGYKISLREEFLDPDVLYAAAELNTTIHNRMEEFAAVEGVDSHAIRQRLRDAEQEVDDIFQGVDEVEATTHARFNQQRMVAEEEVKKRPRKKSKKKKGRVVIGDRKQTSAFRRIATVVVLLGVVGGGGYWIWNNAFGRNKLVDASAVQLSQIHPLLEKGQFSQGKDYPVFIGHLNSSKWLVMPSADREDAAWKIADALHADDVWDAIIYRDNVLAIQIDEGDVVIVE